MAGTGVRARRGECRAIVGRAPGAKGKIDYAEVERLLIRFLAGAGGTAAEQLVAIPEGQSNHARDAAGISVFAAMLPGKATRVA